MIHNSPTNWRALHQAYPGSLKAVGHPSLSETLNELKYGSEAEALTSFLDAHRQLLKDEIHPQIADIGAGTGFWTELLKSWFQSQGMTPVFTVVDISEQALALIKARHPEFQTLRADLTMVDPSHLQERFDLVVSFYCLHHLARVEDFLNGLRFAARSVSSRGILLIMDPILTQPYSPFRKLDFLINEANGIPRSLSMLDDVLEGEGLDRIVIAPAASFILNGSIEARSRLGSVMANALWTILRPIYRSDRATRAAAGAIKWADRLLKRRALAFSSSLVAYRKRPS
jgi:SAM-dependent methyltransferase